MTRLVLWASGLFLVACSSSSEPTGGGQPSSSSGGSAGTGGTASDSGPGGADTWTNFAEAFFATYCVSCHNGTTTGITGDFRNLSDVIQHEADIRCGVATTKLAGCEQSKWPPRQFPVGNGPRPTDAERMRIVAWIDAGQKQ